jgi:hypothetical protein
VTAGPATWVEGVKSNSEQRPFHPTKLFGLRGRAMAGKGHYPPLPATGTEQRYRSKERVQLLARFRKLRHMETAVLLGGCSDRSMRPPGGAHMAHRLLNVVLGVLPRAEARFGVWGETHALHGHAQGCAVRPREPCSCPASVSATRSVGKPCGLTALVLNCKRRDDYGLGVAIRRPCAPAAPVR